MSLLAEMESEFPPEKAAPKRASNNSTPSGSDVFSLARDVDTIQVLDWLGIEHDGKHATCPGCKEENALICENGGLKCLHNRCSHVGPPGFAGFRSNIDLVIAVQGGEPLEAAKSTCERFGIPIPKAKPSAKPLESTSELTEPFRTLSVAEIFADLPPIPYLMQDLDICPGAPTLFAGLGFSAKTLLAHSLALAVACGAPAWGSMPTRAGRVVLLDYEQGSYLTKRRIQRMARGMGLVPDEGKLSLASMPETYLDGEDAESKLSALLKGSALCVIDSLSAACPSLDENSASSRKVIDMLGRVSEATGCVMLLIHHAKKPSKDDVGGSRNSIRGSGAIFDACSTVVVFERQADGQIKLVHQKARMSGKLRPNLMASISDTFDGGLMVAVEDAPQVVGTGSGAAKLDERKAQILEHLAEHGPAASKNAILERLGGRRTQHYAALSELEAEGSILVGDGDSPHVVKLGCQGGG